MEKHLHGKILHRLLLMLVVSLIALSASHAQTPGLIYKPATAGGSSILDPNQDGYVSTTRAGFTNARDEGAANSEIPYRQFPALTTEPLGDLNSGSGGGHTDLATPPTPIASPSTGSPISAYFDGTNLLFRIRLGGSSTASKGYSVLIDSDNTFTGTGANPGFEYEVLLASNFAVQVIRHTPTGTSTIFTGNVDQYSQRSVAGSTSGGNPDYFYDYYVPLTAFQGGITADTPLRMSGITVTSAQSGLTGTVSDVGGVNFQAYGYNAPDAWRALLGAFPPTSLTQIQTTGFPPSPSTAPFVSGPITANSTTISGTSIEAAGSIVTVLRNGVAICGSAGQPTCPTVGPNGTWTLTGIPSTLLEDGNMVTATVTAPGKTVSPVSNTVLVIAGVCTTTPPPVLTGLGTPGNNPKSFIGTTSFSTNQRITIYSTQSTTPVGSFNFNPSTAGTNTFTSPNYTLGEFNFYATVTPLSAAGAVIGCESVRSNQLCFRNGQPNINTQTVTITGVTYNGASQSSTTSPTWSEVPENISSISGTLNLGSTNVAGSIVVFRNGDPTGLSVPFATNTTTWSITTTPAFLATLKPGDVLTVRTDLTLSGGGQSTCPNTYSSQSNLLTVQQTTAAPTIAQPECGLVTRLSGTSTEPAGTVIQFYTGGTAGQRNGTLVTQGTTATPITATVTSTGAWAADFTATTGGGLAAGTAITARAKAVGKVRSVNSNAVTAAPGPAGVLTITGPITEGSTSVSGTGPASAIGGNVTLYIEGTPFPTPVVVGSDGAWSVSGILGQELFAGASVSATFTQAGGCESAQATPVIVSCRPPATTFTLGAPTPATLCGGSTTSVTLSGSEYGISYRLLVNGQESGSSVIGTGGPITLISGPINNVTAANTTAALTYRARSIGGTACDATSINTASVAVRPQPVTTGLSFANPSQAVCANASASFSLTGTNTNYDYQLVDEATGQLVGSPVPGASAAINLSTGPVTTATTYGLRVSFRSGTDPCSITLPAQVSVSISSPSITNAVFPVNGKACVGGATVINVATEPNNDFEYMVYRRIGTTNNPASDPLLGTFRGTGDIIGTPTGNLTTAGNVTFYATVRRLTANTCGTLILSNTATVEVTNAAVTAVAGPDKTACGSTVILEGNSVGPDTGTWSQVSGPTTISFSSPANPNTAAQGFSTGTYVLRWTVQSTCAGSTSTSENLVTITINCEATYTIAVPKYRNQYAAGDVLAFATDSDGGITAATVSQGTLPPGTALAADGTIRVINTTNLAQGVYPLTIRLTDSVGNITVIDIVLRILGDAPVIIPLPVELVYFTATVRNNQAHLEWLTASEQDNDRFEVERSLDAKSFEKIGTVKGKGTTSLETKYKFTDRTPVQGTVYYRLKQVDFDGEFAYSNIIAVTAKGLANELATQVYPNPFQDRVKVTLTSPNAQQAQMVLYDLNGKRVLSKTLDLDAGINEMELQLQQLQSGMYILKIVGDGVESTTRIMKH
jgi:hypothetical protein